MFFAGGLRPIAAPAGCSLDSHLDPLLLAQHSGLGRFLPRWRPCPSTPVEHQHLAAVLLDAVAAVAPVAPGELRAVDYEAAVPQGLQVKSARTPATAR